MIIFWNEFQSRGSEGDGERGREWDGARAQQLTPKGLEKEGIGGTAYVPLETASYDERPLLSLIASREI